MALVTMTALCFSMPRELMHKCLALHTTITP